MFSGQIKGVTAWSPLLQEAELRWVKFLPEILALQKSLVKRFQNVPEAEYQSIRDFISSHTSGRTVLSRGIQNRFSGSKGHSSWGVGALQG